MKIDEERIDIIVNALRAIAIKVEEKKDIQQVKAVVREGMYYSEKQFDRIFTELTDQSFDKFVRRNVYKHCFECLKQEGKKLLKKQTYGNICNFMQNYEYVGGMADSYNLDSPVCMNGFWIYSMKINEYGRIASIMCGYRNCTTIQLIEI